jgi:hypothetical protein
MQKLTVTRKISPIYMLRIDDYTFDIVNPTFDKSEKGSTSFFHPLFPSIISKNLFQLFGIFGILLFFLNDPMKMRFPIKHKTKCSLTFVLNIFYRLGSIFI